MNLGRHEVYDDTPSARRMPPAPPSGSGPYEDPRYGYDPRQAPARQPAIPEQDPRYGYDPRQAPARQPAIPEQDPRYGYDPRNAAMDYSRTTAQFAQPSPASRGRSLQMADAEEELHNVYLRYSSNQTTGEMDSSKFAKLCKDCGIIEEPRFKLSDADLLFSKSKKAGNYGKKINYEEFRTVAFPAMAIKKEISQVELARLIIDGGQAGPSLSGTVALQNRFHDDKRTYTGVHAAGGPTIVDSQNSVKLENLLDRSSADVRGVKVSSTPEGRGQHYPDHPGYDPYLQQNTGSSEGRMSGGRIPERRLSGGAASGSVNPYYYSPEVIGTQTEYYGHSGQLPIPPGRSTRDVDIRGDPAPVSTNVPTVAGQANRKGGIYDRLSNPDSFTGVITLFKYI